MNSYKGYDDIFALITMRYLMTNLFIYLFYLLAIKRLQYIKTIYKYTDKDRGFIRAKALH